MQRQRALLPLVCVALTGMASCAEKTNWRERVAKVLESRPELVFRALESSPERFDRLVNRALERSKPPPEAEAAGPRRVKPVIEADRPVQGPRQAPVTVVAYSDLQCPFCAEGHEALSKVLGEMRGKVRYVLKHLPLEQHPAARPGARWFEAIALQDPAKAFRFQDQVFRLQRQLEGDGTKLFGAIAKKLKVDLGRLKRDLKSPRVEARLQADDAEAQRFGIEGTPAFAIGGMLYEGALPAGEFREAIRKALAAKGGKK